MINIDELMRLREAATPGTWATEYRRRENGMYEKDVFQVENGKTIAKIVWYPKELGNGVTLSYRDANADYIVAACNAVHELVQRIEQLEKENHWLAVQNANTNCCPMPSNCDCEFFHNERCFYIKHIRPDCWIKAAKLALKENER